MSVSLETMLLNPGTHPGNLPQRIAMIDRKILQTWQSLFGGNNPRQIVELTFVARQQGDSKIPSDWVFGWTPPREQEDGDNAGGIGCDGCCDCCNTEIFCCNQRDTCGHISNWCASTISAPFLIAADPIQRLMAPLTSCCVSAPAFANSCGYGGCLDNTASFQDRQWVQEDSVKTLTCCTPNVCCSKGWTVTVTNPEFIAEDCGTNWGRCFIGFIPSLLLTTVCKTGAAASFFCCVDSRQYRRKVETPTYEWMERWTSCGRMKAVKWEPNEPVAADTPRMVRRDRDDDDCCDELCLAFTCCTCLTCWHCC